MLVRDSGQRPDGAGLAKAAAIANLDKIWITVQKRNGEIVNKLVPKGKGGGAADARPKTGLGLRPVQPSDCDGSDFCICAVCSAWGPMVESGKPKRRKVCEVGV